MLTFNLVAALRAPEISVLARVGAALLHGRKDWLTQTRSASAARYAGVFPAPLRHLAHALLFAAIIVSPARAEVIDIPPEADLVRAIFAASARDDAPTLRLAGGDYGALILRDLRPKSPITLISADPTRPATLRALHVERSRDLAFIGLNFTFRPSQESAENDSAKPFVIAGSARIRIAQSRFEGGKQGQPDPRPSGFGLVLRDSREIRLETSSLTRFHRAVVISRSQDISILSNEITAIRSDGIDCAEVQRIRISGNYIHDFDRLPASKDHADMIQFWTRDTERPSTDILIENNILASGRGLYTQSIFLRNERAETEDRPDLYYKNLRIIENVIINAHAHGITVGEAQGVEIARNSVLRNARSSGRFGKASLWTPQIRVSARARDVVIRDNLTAAIHGGEQGWVVQGNLIVQEHNPQATGFYGALFSGAMAQDPSKLARFTPRKDGPLSHGPLGAALRSKGFKNAAQALE